MVKAKPKEYEEYSSPGGRGKTGGRLARFDFVVVTTVAYTRRKRNPRPSHGRHTINVDYPK